MSHRSNRDSKTITEALKETEPQLILEVVTPKNSRIWTRCVKIKNSSNLNPGNNMTPEANKAPKATTN